MRGISAIVAYVYNDMPSNCHGSMEVYGLWLEYCELLRDKAKVAEIDDKVAELKIAKQKALAWRHGR